jgi:hypothetical protein
METQKQKKAFLGLLSINRKIFHGLPYYRKEGKYAYEITIQSMCICLFCSEPLNQSIHFHETWYDHTPLQDTMTSYFLFFTVTNNMTDMGTCKVGLALVMYCNRYSTAMHLLR